MSFLNAANTAWIGGILPVTDPAGVTLFKRLSGEGLDSGTLIKIARRRDVTRDDARSAGVEISERVCAWQLWNSGELLPDGVTPFFPSQDDVIQRADGTRWTVKSSIYKLFGNLHSVPVSVKEGV